MPAGLAGRSVGHPPFGADSRAEAPACRSPLAKGHSRRRQPGSVRVPGFSGKFDQALRLLGRLQEWCDKEICPDEYPEVMDRLYGDLPTLAGERIKELFLQLFDDDEAVCEKARQDLPKRIGQERSDVQQDRELYYREVSLQAKRGALSEEKVAAKEALLERQISEQMRLLTHLKSKRSLWGSEPEADEALSSGAGSTKEAEDEKNTPKRPNEANKSFVLAVPPGNEPKPSQQVL